MRNKKFLLVAAVLALSMAAPLAAYAEDPLTDPPVAEESAEDPEETAEDPEATDGDATDTPEVTAPEVKYVIEDLELHSTMTTITGKLPVFKEVADTEFSDKINGIVNTFFEETVKKAEAEKENAEGETVEATFSYEVMGDAKYLSVVLRGGVTVKENATQDVKTIVLDKNEFKLYTLVDILGSNAYQIADDYINANIASRKADYFADDKAFKGVTAETDFYVNNDSALVIAFGKNEISQYDSASSFTIDLGNYVSLGLPAAEYYTNEGVVMLPLRKVAEMFRYTIEWDPEISTAYVVSGDVKYPVKAGVTEQTEYTLTSAPTEKDDLMYVPIAFADVLGIAQDTTTETINLSKLFYTVAVPEPVDSSDDNTTEGEGEDDTTTEGEEAPAELSVKGEIIELSSSSITIRDASNYFLTFSLTGVDVSGVTNLLLGYTVEVFYTGEIVSDNTSEAVVSRIVSVE